MSYNGESYDRVVGRNCGAEGRRLTSVSNEPTLCSRGSIPGEDNALFLRFFKGLDILTVQWRRQLG